VKNEELAVELAGVALRNPLVLASGTAGYALELASLIDLSRLGAVILKSVTEEPRRGNPEPRIWETTGGMLNSIGLENIGVEALVGEVLPRLGGLGTPVFASIAGDTVRAYARLAARIQGAQGLSALEVNISCPNVEKGGMQFGCDPGATSSVVKAVRENTGLPIFVKLSAAVAEVTRIAEAAAQAGASGLSLINTVPGMAIDPVTRRPRLGAISGGLSGPAIKPIALKAVWDCCNATGLPIVGGGGVFDEYDVIEFMLAGATAVSVGSSNFQDPDRALQILQRLPAALQQAGAGGCGELIGAMKT
jgi:dihydroorotate dehydrogenase (NAD+) catalytic subunit